jgi:hypothetical protein
MRKLRMRGGNGLVRAWGWEFPGFFMVWGRKEKQYQAEEGVFSCAVLCFCSGSI